MPPLADIWRTRSHSRAASSSSSALSVARNLDARSNVVIDRIRPVAESATPNARRCPVSLGDLFVSTPASNSKTDVVSSVPKFGKHQRVLFQSLVHATYPDAAQSILAERFLRGGYEGTAYDGVLADHPHAASLATAFCHVRPESDGFILPYTLYPRDVPAHADVSILKVDMGALASDEYHMFYHRTDRVNFDAAVWAVAQTQVVFVHKDDERELEFARRVLTPIDKHSNSILRYSRDEGWSCARQFSGNLSHTVIAVFLGGLRLDQSLVEVIPGKKLAEVDSYFHCLENACHFKAPSIHKFRDHYRRCHAAVDYTCDVDGCGDSFMSKNQLYYHTKAEHGSGESAHRCTHAHCEFHTPSFYLLTRHLRVEHDPASSLSCAHPGCHFSSSSPSSRTAHERLQHSGVKPYVCEECDFSTHRNNDLKHHMRSSHSPSLRACRYCEYKTEKLFDLKKHTRVNHGNASHLPLRSSCMHPGCVFSSTSAADGDTHRVVHTGLRPFVCRECDFSTFHDSELRRHESTHSFAHECSHPRCDFKAHNIADLNLHLRLFHGRGDSIAATRARGSGDRLGDGPREFSHVDEHSSDRLGNDGRDLVSASLGSGDGLGDSRREFTQVNEHSRDRPGNDGRDLVSASLGSGDGLGDGRREFTHVNEHSRDRLDNDRRDLISAPRGTSDGPRESIKVKEHSGDPASDSRGDFTNSEGRRESIDSVQSSENGDSLQSSESGDLLQSSEGEDLLHSSESIDSSQSSQDEDSLHSSEGEDSIQSSEGEDSIQSSEGEDLLHSSESIDSSQSSEGEDSLHSSEGEDSLRGCEDHVGACSRQEQLPPQIERPQNATATDKRTHEVTGDPISTSQSRSPSRSYVCAHRACDYSTHSLMNLKAHRVYRHQGALPYVCLTCDSPRAEIGGRIGIVTTPNRSPPLHSCRHDGCAFSSPSLLNKSAHELYHSGVVPHVCSVCDTLTLDVGVLRRPSALAHSA